MLKAWIGTEQQPVCASLDSMADANFVSQEIADRYAIWQQPITKREVLLTLADGTKARQPYRKAKLLLQLAKDPAAPDRRQNTQNGLTMNYPRDDHYSQVVTVLVLNNIAHTQDLIRGHHSGLQRIRT